MKDKMLNKAIADIENRRHKTILTAYPSRLIVDPSDLCNLKCVFCPTGQGKRKYTGTIMPLKNFMKIIDLLGPSLTSIEFCNWGEPLLNKNIYDMVAYAKNYNISCILSTNFNKFSEKDAEPLISSGLDYLIVSCDGINQRTYEKYRVGGNFARVIENMSILLNKRKIMNASNPTIEWQYVVFRHNEKYIDKAIKMKRLLGIDRINFASAWINSVENNYKKWLPRNKHYCRYNLKIENGKPKQVVCVPVEKSCNYLWTTIVLDAGGNVFPCCSELDHDSNFGNIFTDNFNNIWNGKKYQASRSFFINRNKSSSVNIPCYSCHDIQENNIPTDIDNKWKGL